jgi:hypothetical protein
MSAGSTGMNPLTEQQVENNAASRDRWELFRPHRDRVTELLRGSPAEQPRRLCVLGAGNCNDLDLAALLAAYREVHLIDLDGEALAHGVARQGRAGHPSVRPHGGLDLTGALDRLTAWSPQAVLAEGELAACAEAPLRQIRPALAGPFDVAASVCLLSQLMNAVVRTAGEKHPRFLEALRAVRAGHLRLLADLVAPGGTGVLVTDVVSSDSFPALASVREDLLPALLGQLVRERNFFHGVNPIALASFFETDPAVAPQVTGLEWVRPWLWDFGPRVYLVCACTFRTPVAPPAS